MGIAFVGMATGLAGGWNALVAPLQAVVGFFAPWQADREQNQNAPNLIATKGLSTLAPRGNSPKPPSEKAANRYAARAATAGVPLAPKSVNEGYRSVPRDTIRQAPQEAPREVAAREVASPRNCQQPRRAVRVLRVLEAQAPRHVAGRMLISGRMADVCAELERLAQSELAAA